MHAWFFVCRSWTAWTAPSSACGRTAWCPASTQSTSPRGQTAPGTGGQGTSRPLSGEWGAGITLLFYSGWPGQRGPNIAQLKSHIAQKRTLLHKQRKKYRPKPEFWAFFAFYISKFYRPKDQNIAQNLDLGDEIAHLATLFLLAPPLLFPRFVYVAFLVLLAGHLAGIAACLVEKALAPTLSLDQRTKATGCWWLKKIFSFCHFWAGWNFIFHPKKARSPNRLLL